MSELQFKIIFVVLWVIYMLIRAPFDMKYQKIEKIKRVKETNERILLFFLALGLILIPTLWLFTPFIDNFNIPFPNWVRILGIIIAVISLFYFIWIHRILGANWSPTLEIRRGHELIKTGPYKYIRHPMYSQIWIWTFAQFLIVSNSLAGIPGILAWALIYFIRVPKEEKMLTENFGDEYIEYSKKTGRLFPKFIHHSK